MKLFIFNLFRTVDSKEKEVASTMLGSFLGIGLSVGSSISLLMVKNL
jgi:hypothetical protein